MRTIQTSTVSSDNMFVFVIFVFSFLFSATCSQIISVTTPLGVFQGTFVTTTNGYQMQAFQKIPYAQAPNDSTRFSRPSSLTTLAPNPYNSTVAPLPCARWGTDGKTMDAQSSEDCLYLKVLTPANVTCCMPVMFWIQSGGFNDGGYPSYDNNALGDNFVSKGVVIVQVDHRQGPFGFFTTGTTEAEGNWGVWDALEALKFVRTNINSFGGDINRITIMGQESGAVMAELLSLSPMTKGLYSSMILIDGTAFDPAIMKNDNITVQRSQLLAYLVNCDDDSRDLWGSGQRTQVLTCLRNATTDQLVSTIGRQDIQTVDPGSTINNYFWRPRVDGANGLFPNTFEALATQRAVVPTIVGFMQRDWLIELLPFQSDRTGNLPANFNATYNTQAFVNQTCNNLMTSDIYGAQLVATLRTLCMETYVNNQVVDSLYYWTHTAARVSTGFHLIAPIYKSVTFMRNQGNGLVYMYSFDYDRETVSPYWEATGGSRFLEVMLAENYGPPFFQFTAEDIYIQDIFSDMLTNFAKFFNPTPLGYTKSKNYWLTYGGTNCYFSIDNTSTMMPQFYQSDSLLWINNGALSA